jgi:hypothetical protein
LSVSKAEEVQMDNEDVIVEYTEETLLDGEGSAAKGIMTAFAIMVPFYGLLIGLFWLLTRR